MAITQEELWHSWTSISNSGSKDLAPLIPSPGQGSYLLLQFGPGNHTAVYFVRQTHPSFDLSSHITLSGGYSIRSTTAQSAPEPFSHPPFLPCTPWHNRKKCLCAEYLLSGGSSTDCRQSRFLFPVVLAHNDIKRSPCLARFTVPDRASHPYPAKPSQCPHIDCYQRY